MRAIAAITVNTFREVVRQRLFLLIIILTAATLAVMLLFPYFTGREDTAMFKDLALSTATLAMVFLVALTASSAMAEEIESRTATTVLAKPVSRWQFLLGKYLGVVLALVVATAVLAALLFLTTYIRVYLDAWPRDRALAFTFSQSEPAREFQAKMLNNALATVPGSVMIFYQGAVLTAVAVVLSSRFSRVLAVIVTFGLFLAGHLSEFVEAAVRHSTDLTRSVATWTIHLAPFLETFNLTSRLSHAGQAPGSEAFAAVWAYTGLAGLYALAYAVFVLLLGTALIRGREMA